MWIYVNRRTKPWNISSPRRLLNSKPHRAKLHPTKRNRRKNQEDGNWETYSFGVYEASRPSTDAHKKWDDLNLPAMCDLERRLRLVAPAGLLVVKARILLDKMESTNIYGLNR
ncbi:hypothetical protein BJX66DRAFT_319420 [Aspergillus keveii]|uniref:Uncharacterized protein n=1 Tax=Aspergillus keveii TaxID=714993 RepID=A0ABR4FI88_9EURO